MVTLPFSSVVTMQGNSLISVMFFCEGCSRMADFLLSETTIKRLFSMDDTGSVVEMVVAFIIVLSLGLFNGYWLLVIGY